MDYVMFRSTIEAQAKDTIGHEEAENKISFLVGVSVATSKAWEYFEEQIKDLEIERNTYRTMHQEVKSDIVKLCSIIERYSDKD